MSQHGPGDPLAATADDDRAGLISACTGRDADGRADPVADRLLMRMVRRRTWAVHRHVHLVDAFRTAHARRPITTVLAAGCGTGLSELFLARSFPDVHFTLTDIDAEYLAGPTSMIAELGLTNVSIEVLDLLAPRCRDRVDLVTSIEVLEHIEDDGRAAASLIDHAAGHVHLLVPYCSPAQLADPRHQARVWETNGHVRVGYTHDTFAALLDDHDRVFLRNAYLMPEALALRGRLTGPPDDDIVAQRVELVTDALVDLRDVTVTGGSRDAEAIEVLLDVRAARDRDGEVDAEAVRPR